MMKLCVIVVIVLFFVQSQGQRNVIPYFQCSTPIANNPSQYLATFGYINYANTTETIQKGLPFENFFSPGPLTYPTQPSTFLPGYHPDAFTITLNITNNVTYDLQGYLATSYFSLNNLCDVTNCSCPAGPQGPQGFNGSEGPQGIQGPQGDVGPQGTQGIQGPQGNTGPQGIQGNTGPQGPIGNTGPQGATGPQGDVGPQGPAGPSGGFNANNCTIVTSNKRTTDLAIVSDSNCRTSASVCCNKGQVLLSGGGQCDAGIFPAVLSRSIIEKSKDGNYCWQVECLGLTVAYIVATAKAVCC